MIFLFEHPSNPEPHQGSNERPHGRASRCQLVSATDRGRPQVPNDASARSFARLAPPAPIEAADDAVEAEPAAARDFVASIREAIETLSCGEDYPTIRTTAEYVGMSVRTLQRRLAQAGASHHVLVAQARFATAAVVLERTDAKILELALNLGYSDHANFTRAFRRWAGCAPREYRSNNTRHEDVPDPLQPRRRGFGPPTSAPTRPLCRVSDACAAR
jgi:AraC-like DNA-binding protein